MSLRRLISRLVLFVAILVGTFTFAANATLTAHRTADAWPNPLSVTTNPPPAPTSDPTIVEELQTVTDTIVEG